jgi:CRISPR-associated protein Csm1
LLWVTDENRNPSDEPCAEILGQRWYLLKNQPANPPGNAVLYRTRGMDFLEGAKENDTMARGFRFVATHVPGTFEEMAKKAEGADYLAALRMDVDDMGYLLAKVPDEFQTPSFYASVSRLLDLFFSGYMNTMIRGDEALYIVYAGGDDLFIVGAWDKVLEKALEISEKFGKYTDNPESLHLSGGHYIFKPKFPIGRAAEGAGKAESRAKKEKRHKQESSGEKSETKNALCAFGEVFSWDKVKEALGFSDKLLEYMKDEKISRSFVQTLLDIYHRDYKDKRLIWAARVMYQLARNVPDELVAELEKELVRGNKMETAQLWANIALLKTREKP